MDSIVFLFIIDLGGYLALRLEGTTTFRKFPAKFPDDFFSQRNTVDI